MGVICDRGRYYWVKRVPKRYKGLVLGRDGKPVSQVRQALHTASKSEANQKAIKVEAAKLAEWEALAAGDTGSAVAMYEAAKKLAEARGFDYKPLVELLQGSLEQVIEQTMPRLQALGTPQAPAPPAHFDALLGGVPKALPNIQEVLQEYFELSQTAQRQKSAAQLRRWRRERERAVECFCDVVYGPRPRRLSIRSVAPTL